MGDTERLRNRYDGAVEAAPDTLLTLEAAETLHLAARGRDGPACHDSEPREWRRVKTRDALSFGGSQIYHAPTGDGAFCDADTDDIVEREALEPHYRPCGECFDVEER